MENGTEPAKVFPQQGRNGYNLSAIENLIFPSPLSNQPITDSTLIGAGVELQENSSQVFIYLWDKESLEIFNSTIKCRVNGRLIPFGDPGGLPTLHIPYRDSAVPHAVRYVFEIDLSNGRRHELGRVDALPSIDSQSIQVVENGSYDQDFVMRWKNKNRFSVLGIKKMIYTGTTKERGHTYQGLAEGKHRIDSTGRWVLPKHTYRTTDGVLSAIELTFYAGQIGQVHPKWLPSSFIMIEINIKKSVEFDELPVLTPHEN